MGEQHMRKISDSFPIILVLGIAAVITVVLADNNLIVRTGVRALLAREADVEVVGEGADLPELLAAAADELRPA